MKWRTFKALSAFKRCALFSQELYKDCIPELEQYKKDFPNQRISDEQFKFLLALILEFNAAPSTTPWARIPILKTAGHLTLPQNKGEDLLFLMRRYGPLCWGWRTQGGVARRGILQILTTHFDKLHEMKVFLAGSSDLSNLTMKETAQLFIKRKVDPIMEQAALDKAEQQSKQAFLEQAVLDKAKQIDDIVQDLPVNCAPSA